MIDKIIFKKDDSVVKLKQLEFEMPVGYKLYNPLLLDVDCYYPSTVKFGVTIYSERPATLIYTSAIHSTDFKIVNPIQMVAPNIPTELAICVINPIQNSHSWELYAGGLVATLVVLETYAVNLFEMSNKVFDQYVQ